VAGVRRVTDHDRDHRPQPGIMQAHVFVLFAGLLVVLVPVVWWLVPDHRGNW
jgi:hypothetical protein